ncbi:MAG: GNAT family N-acetyltransferase [Deltaproteobacteria bacterium]|nr:GNAT family N-acetyltransferase [Deltaproteobacteria bacterium]
MIIEQVTTVDAALVTAFARLIPQLSTVAPPAAATLAALVAQPGCTLLIARADDGTIVGALTLTTYRIPTGLQARIDDVVVDDLARGHGIGEALSRAAIERARQAGARSVTLTSRPARAAANRLYERLGFLRIETTVYRYPL